MKRELLALALSGAPLSGCMAVQTTTNTVAPPAAKSSEEAAVKASVLDYFQGQGEASEDRLNRAFAEDVAVMIGPANGGAGFQRSDISDVITSWSSNPNPIGKRFDYGFLSVNIVDDRLATVTFRSTDRFYDALTLMKQNGEWQIVTKAYIRQ